MKYFKEFTEAPKRFDVLVAQGVYDDFEDLELVEKIQDPKTGDFRYVWKSRVKNMRRMTVQFASQRGAAPVRDFVGGPPRYSHWFAAAFRKSCRDNRNDMHLTWSDHLGHFGRCIVWTFMYGLPFGVLALLTAIFPFPGSSYPHEGECNNCRTEADVAGWIAHYTLASCTMCVTVGMAVFEDEKPSAWYEKKLLAWAFCRMFTLVISAYTILFVIIGAENMRNSQVLFFGLWLMLFSLGVPIVELARRSLGYVDWYKPGLVVTSKRIFDSPNFDPLQLSEEEKHKRRNAILQRCGLQQGLSISVIIIAFVAPCYDNFLLSRGRLLPSMQSSDYVIIPIRPLVLYGIVGLASHLFWFSVQLVGNPILWIYFRWTWSSGLALFAFRAAANSSTWQAALSIVGCSWITFFLNMLKVYCHRYNVKFRYLWWITDLGDIPLLQCDPPGKMSRLKYLGYNIVVDSIMYSSIMMTFFALYPIVSYFYTEEHMLYRYLYPEGRQSVLWVGVFVASELIKDVCARKYLYRWTGCLFSRYVGRIWTKESANIIFILSWVYLWIVWYIQIGWLFYTQRVGPFED